VKEHRFGASATLTGIRSRRHEFETSVPVRRSVSNRGMPSLRLTEVSLAACSNKHSVYYVIHLFAPQSCEIVIVEAAFQPLYLAVFDALRKTVV
jgi:hypothetical protein